MDNDGKSIFLKLMCSWVVPFRFINPFNIQNVWGVDESGHIAWLWGSHHSVTARCVHGAVRVQWQNVQSLVVALEVPHRTTHKVWFIILWI